MNLRAPSLRVAAALIGMGLAAALLAAVVFRPGVGLRPARDVPPLDFDEAPAVARADAGEGSWLRTPVP